MNQVYWIITTFGKEPKYPTLPAKRWYFTTKDLSEYTHSTYSSDFRDAYLFVNLEDAYTDLTILSDILGGTWEVREIRVRME